MCLRKSIESARQTVKLRGFVETYLVLFSVFPSIFKNFRQQPLISSIFIDYFLIDRAFILNLLKLDIISQIQS